MSFGWSRMGILVGGMLLGSYGTKILKSRDAKKVFTHAAAAVFRMKDEVMKDYTEFTEECSDIAADARAINEKRAAEEEAAVIEDAKAILAKAEADVEA